MRLVVTHAGCDDGRLSAAVILRHLRASGLEEGTVFRPCRYGDPPPEEVGEASEIWIADFSLPAPVMAEVADRVRSS